MPITSRILWHFDLLHIRGKLTYNVKEVIFLSTYYITISDDIAIIYEQIALACNKTTEEVLQDTLYKVMDIISMKLVNNDE